MLIIIRYTAVNTDRKHVSESPGGAVHTTRIDARGQCSFKTFDFTVTNPDAAGRQKNKIKTRTSEVLLVISDSIT